MKAKDIFWVIVSPLAPLLVLAGILLYASSLMFTIPIGIIVFITKGIIKDDKRKKFFEQLRVDRVKQYPKDEYGKPLWEELDVSKSVESLLVETNNDTKSAIACAKKQIDIAVQRLDQLDEQLILYGIERAKWLSSIDKWNSIIIGIKKVDKDNKKYNIKLAFQIFLAAIITVGLIAFIALLITSYIPKKDNHTISSHYSNIDSYKVVDKVQTNITPFMEMLMLSDSIETYRDIDEEYYKHPIVYTPIKTSVASSAQKHKTTQSSEKMVYICTGPSAYRYHSRSSCRGLNRCSDDIERVTISEARDLGRTPCGYCY